MAGEVFGEESSFLALAAWFHRLGHDDLAAAALDVPRALEEDPLQNLRTTLGMEAFRAVGAAFRAGDDAAAVAVGEHFLRRYADASSVLHDEARVVVADARRRRQSGRLGHGPAQARVEVGRPGRSTPAGRTDRRSMKSWTHAPTRPLVGRGRSPDPLHSRTRQAAVPALIDVVEGQPVDPPGAATGGCSLGEAARRGPRPDPGPRTGRRRADVRPRTQRARPAPDE